MTVMAARRRALPVVVSSTIVTVWSLGWAWRMWPDAGVSWHFSVDGANLLLHGSGLNLFADAPWLQTGPLSLVVAAALAPLPANVGKSLALIAMAAASHGSGGTVGRPGPKNPPDAHRGHGPHPGMDSSLCPVGAPR